MRLAITVIATICASFHVLGIAAPRNECPDVIRPAAVQVEMYGWQSYIEFPLRLSSAGVAAGPPDMRAGLKGERISKRSELEVTVFRFGETGFEQGKWLVCSYGQGGEISLHKRLPENLKACTVSYQTPAKAPRQSIRIDCE
ncbi:STY0301 family protein [Pseudoduganella sp.]|uniref:STY0301 family protein n=1 Tax=Pseudoduganella sp. TaxID=1880898 RepID=UPI0035B4814E